MARPQKTGLEYFPLDVDIFSDVKVMKLIRRYGNGTAFSIFVALMCRIYKEGYYIKYEEDDTVFHLSVVLNEDDEKMIGDVIHGCLDIGLFDKDMFEQHHVLTSAAIQRRYNAIQQSSRRVSKITQYKCNSDAESDTETVVTATETTKKSKKQSSNKQKCTETADNTSEIAIKENKENKIKEKINSSTPSPSSACACETEEVFGDKPVDEDLLEKEAELLKKSVDWRKETKKYYNLSDEYLEELLQRFTSHCRIITRTKHKSLEDLRTHFNSWIQKELEKRPQPTKSMNHGTRQQSQPSTNIEYTHLNPRRSAPCPTNTTQADYE